MPRARPLRPLRDPREDERWFRRLPPAHQARFRSDWEREREHWVELEHNVRRARKRAAIDGALLFASVTFLMLPLRFEPLAFALLGGALAGLIWHVIEADAVLAPILAMPAFFASHVLPATAGVRGYEHGLGFMQFAFASFLVGSGASWLAHSRRQFA